MLGEQRIHRALPYCSSDLADWVSLEYVGPALTWEEEAVRGSVDDGQFTVWYLRGARLVAALMIGRSEDLDSACALIAEQTDLSHRRDQLSDPAGDPAGVMDQPGRR
jgi:3-phenylpropionate/trans-cinnamate dioxygenase ferredoxin reductase subunit